MPGLFHTYIAVSNGFENDRESERNDKFAAPSDQQIRWHIRHIRQDIRLIASYAMLYLVLIATLLAAIVAKLYSR